MNNISLNHLIGEEEQAIFCPSCKKEHKANFESVFLGNWHYIRGYCVNCNYRILKRSDNLGMGFNHLSKEEKANKIKECFKI